MYYFTIAGKVSTFFNVLAIVSTVTFALSVFITLICMAECGVEEAWAFPILKKLRKWTVVMAIPMWLIFIAIPSQHDILLIVAGGSVGHFIESDSSVKALPSQVTLFLKEELGKQIHEVTASDTMLAKRAIEAGKAKIDSIGKDGQRRLENITK
jgi:hypothetical protein